MSLRMALVVAATISGRLVNAQELEPNAYAANPTGVNFLLVGYAESRGEILFDPSVGITDVDAAWQSLAIGYGHTFALFGRTANFAAALPYINGEASGNVQEQFTEVSRKGFADPRLRLGINLLGGPALSPAEFRAYKPRTTIGFTLFIVPPLGQYYPDKLINLGSNRWSVKTEIGVSQPVENWRFELAAGAWFFTDNDDFFGGQHRSQNPIATVQAHIIYTFKPRTWLAIDSTWYGGGRSYIDGNAKSDLQSNTRLGITFALPLNNAHSIKLAYSTGVATRIGGDFSQFNVAWQYTWF